VESGALEKQANILIDMQLKLFTEELFLLLFEQKWLTQN
jgi:hypothetical protein